jgi:hypothetical protein
MVHNGAAARGICAVPNEVPGPVERSWQVFQRTLTHGQGLGTMTAQLKVPF